MAANGAVSGKFFSFILHFLLRNLSQLSYVLSTDYVDFLEEVNPLYIMNKNSGFRLNKTNFQ